MAPRAEKIKAPRRCVQTLTVSSVACQWSWSLFRVIRREGRVAEFEIGSCSSPTYCG